jgi:hypothetical protein
MEKTHSLRHALVIRAEIFGFVFLMALLAALFAGCGDGTESDGSTDSGTVGTGTKTGTATVTCLVPDASKTSTPHAPGLPPVQFLTSSNSVSCSGIKTAYPVLASTSCADLASNAWSVPSDLRPCCVFGTRNVSTGYMDNSQVLCGEFMPDMGQYALCSPSGSFLGWVCSSSMPLFSGK